MAKRNFLQRLLNIKQLDTSEQAHTHQIDRIASMLAIGPEHELQQMLNECSVSGKIPLPRQWMRLSRLMYSKITLYKEAIDKTVSFVGNVRLSEGSNVSDRTKALIEQYWTSVGMLSEYEPKIANVRGMNSIVTELVKNALRDGMAFAEDRYEEIEGEVTDIYSGCMVFNSDNFDYAPVGYGSDLLLRYCGNQFPQIDPETGERKYTQYFHALKLESDQRSPWGLPLVAGDEMITKTVISLLISIELQSKRFGNPPTLTTITPKDLESLGKNDFQINGQSVSPQDALLRSVSKLKSQVEKSWELSHKGKAAEIVQGFPAPVDISSKVLGEGMAQMVDDELTWKLVVILLNGFGVPPSLFGISVTSGGMNSDMFASLLQVFHARINRIRQAIAPIIKQKTVNYLLSENVNPAEAEAFEIEFENVDIEGAEQKSKIEKTNAETKQIQIMNYETLLNYDEEAARNYGEKVGLF